MLENKFKSDTIEEIREMLPGCIIIHGNSASVQGIPDMMILYYNKWAVLEFKKTAKSIHQPNQDYYVEMLDEWSFAAFIFPENKEEVLDAIQLAFRAARPTRISRT